MISQNCPKCLSSRVRRGYRPTPWWSKLLFRYNLLCDNCNWEFRGFAVPGTVSAKPTKTPKKKVPNKMEESVTVDSPETFAEETLTAESPAVEHLEESPSETPVEENPLEESLEEVSAEESVKTNVAQKSVPKSKKKKSVKAVAAEARAKPEAKPKAKKAKGKSGI